MEDERFDLIIRFNRIHFYVVTTIINESLMKC